MTLARDLGRALRGEVLFGAGDRALYATDASNYRKVPIGVVRPRDAEDVARALAVCAEHGVPVLSRGGGTSLAGQCCNVAVVLDFSRHMTRLVALDPDRRTATVEPGVRCDQVRHAAEAYGLTFAPDPSTHGWCTLGGMIGNNSCGVHTVRGGRTVDNVHALRVITARGEALSLGAYDDAAYDAVIAAGGLLAEKLRALRTLRDRHADRIRAAYPNIPRRVSGYSLDELLPERGFHVARSVVGSEGTLLTVVEATVRLVPSPPHRAIAALGFPTVYDAADHVPELLRTGCIGLEGMDDVLVGHIRDDGSSGDWSHLLPPGKGWLFAEYGGDTAEDAVEAARAAAAGAKGAKWLVIDDEEDQAKIWALRETGLAATARPKGLPDAWEGWEDAAVPPARLGDYLRDFQVLLDRYGYHTPVYGHFGDGCVHCRITFDLKSAAGIAQWKAFLEEAADLVVGYGGSLSGEHGDGVSKAWLLPKMFGPELIDAFREVKRIWDPDGRMNPGRVVDPLPPEEDLRLGASDRPVAVATVFRYPEDDGSLRRAVDRCVGVGKCRRTGGGTMCPSYQVTLEEKHSTRGRARLLHEMLRVDSPVSSPEMRDAAVYDALDLCLSCKGCKSDCPMHVDMATYKAEFTYRYFRGRLRPRIAYTFGMMPLWARALGLAPRLVNLLARAPGVKWLLGVAPERPLPRFATTSFKRWFRSRPPSPPGERIVLWPDTWTDRLHPEVGIAAVEVLEAAGFEVVVPDQWMCCGRPLYDYGMLDLARRWLGRCLDALGPYAEAGVPIVVLEPSCASVFRDELRNLYPGDPRAEAVRAHTRTLAELLTDRRPDFAPAIAGEVVLHNHCHHKAVLGTDADRALLARTGAEVRFLDVGCCGMSGLFGYEIPKFELSKQIGDHGVLREVREMADASQLCTDGFSCRTQVRDLAPRQGLHLAEVLQRAIRANAE